MRANKQQQTRRLAIVRAPQGIASGTSVRKTGNPGIRNSRDSVVVNHSELFASLSPIDSSADIISAWTIQPSYDTLFPWLSSLAAKYQYYRIRSIAIRYIPNVPTTTEGLVFLAFHPDPSDPIPPSDLSGKQALMSEPCAQCCPIWKEQRLSCSPILIQDRHRAQPELFVRLTQDTSQDARVCDFGYIFVGLYNHTQSLGHSCGDLYVDYEIEFRQPCLHAQPSAISEDSRSKLRAWFTPSVRNDDRGFSALGFSVSQSKGNFPGFATGSYNATVEGVVEGVKDFVLNSPSGLAKDTSLKSMFSGLRHVLLTLNWGDLGGFDLTAFSTATVKIVRQIWATLSDGSNASGWVTLPNEDITYHWIQNSKVTGYSGTYGDHSLVIDATLPFVEGSCYQFTITAPILDQQFSDTLQALGLNFSVDHRFCKDWNIVSDGTSYRSESSSALIPTLFSSTIDKQSKDCVGPEKIRFVNKL